MDYIDFNIEARFIPSTGYINLHLIEKSDELILLIFIAKDYIKVNYYLSTIESIFMNINFNQLFLIVYSLL